jgi:threonine dehydratase
VRKALKNFTPAAFAAGFFFERATFLRVLHINLKRKNPQKIRVFKIRGILHAEKQKKEAKNA